MMSQEFNIDPKGRFQRRMSGIVWAIASVAASEILIAGAFPQWYQILLFLPLFLAMLGFMQASAGT